MTPELKALITSEIMASIKVRAGEIDELTNRANDLLAQASALRAASITQITCDARNAHQFEEVPGTGKLGDRFEEKCIHCGWIHTS